MATTVFLSQLVCGAKDTEFEGEKKMVGATGFEPATSSSQNWHSTKLSYAPTREKHTLTNEKIKISLP